MKSFNHNVSALVLAVCVTLFFALLLPHHLHLQEQQQLFLFDWQYISEVLSVPGGLADVMGRFCTQFFIYAWVGAAIVGLLIAAIWRLMRLVVSSFSHDVSAWGWADGLLLLPSGLLMGYMCDENALFGTLWAIMLSMLATVVLAKISNWRIQCLIGVIGSVAMYWLVGPLAVVFVVLSSLYLVSREKNTSVGITVALMVVLFVIQPMIARRLVSIDMDRLLYGVHYYRILVVHPSLPWLSALSIICASIICMMIKDKAKAIIRIASNGFAGLLICLLIWHELYNPKVEKVLAYDFMVRCHQWDRIIDTASRQSPNNAFCTTVLNLALAQKGKLTERMFDYQQSGIAGLIPAFQRDAISPMAAAEVFYYIGMVNSAQRFVFEAQEAIPDFQKSGRCYKRLAETNIINGNYEVARKYLASLQKSWYYRQWATETMSLLDNEAAIAKHREYGYLRKFKLTDDFFFSDREIIQMLGSLFMSNRHNRLAFEYLEAANLLTCNLEMFVQCIGLNSDINYPVVPTIYQQAIMLWWAREHNASEGLPNGVRHDIASQFNRFAAAIQSQPVNYDKLKEQFGNTYWYYYFTNIQK